MKLLNLIPTIFISLGVFSPSRIVYADGNDTNNYKVLSSTNKKLSIRNVETFLKEGDALIKAGEFNKAKESFDKARNLARQLAGFYGDLNGSFRGLDARIPKEMAPCWITYNWKPSIHIKGLVTTDSHKKNI